MGQQTDIIRYNLKERGRRFRGQPRSFNVPALMDNINGPATQERVKHRDMLGYYGHWPRVAFGLNPAEGGIVDGVAVSVQPAFVTTFLKCYADGTIEHRAEFLETEPGEAAAALNKAKAGGFSSAIHEPTSRFFGFDYVLEPNFSTNRTYEVALDGVGADALTMDDVDEYLGSVDEILKLVALLDGVNAENDRLRRSVSRLTMDNDELIDKLAKRGVRLDSAEPVHLNPAALRQKSGPTKVLFDSANTFKQVQVERLASPISDRDRALAGKIARFRAAFMR